MDEPAIPDDVREGVGSAFHTYIDALAPFRPEFYRYCRGLTGNVWDAEDLVHDALLKGFASLGSAQGTIANPKGYLIRIATNLWIDKQRRRVVERNIAEQNAHEGAAAFSEPVDGTGVRNAAARLIELLSPKERAAVVLKDVFDMNLKDIAGTLATTENAVKAALHRGRGRLRHASSPAHATAASLALVEKFVACLDRSDLPGLLALMLDTATIEMRPVLLENGRVEFERKGSWLWHSVNVHPDLPEGQRPPKWVNRVVVFQGEAIVLGLMPPSHGGTLQGINRFEEEDGRIAAIRSYCFSPEVAAEVAATFGLTAGWIPYRFPFS